MFSALLLAMPALNGNISVLSSNPEATTDQSANTNANTDSSSAVTPPDANANASANTASSDNNNGALIQTPATNQVEKRAANTVATGDPAGNANTGKKAPAASPAKKK
jgi:hypothetical protein